MGLTPVSKYDYGYLYCKTCGEYIKTEDCFIGRDGKLYHKICGRLVRVKPRRPKKVMAVTPVTSLRG